MQRWYPDRIGGMFTANAEALADLALRQPSVGMAEVGFTCEPTEKHFCRASMQLAEQPIKGWVKVEAREMMGRQVFFGSLATLLGAPSAPYIHLRGIDEVFSPECIEQPHALGTVDCYHRLSAATLGAAGQWRIFINDSDGMHNAAANHHGRFYLYDPNANPDWDDYINPVNTCFIEDGLKAASELNGDGHEAYMGGAQKMAQRITTVKLEQLQTLAATIRKATQLTISSVVVTTLAERIDLFEQPCLPLPSPYRQNLTSLTAPRQQTLLRSHNLRGYLLRR